MIHHGIPASSLLDNFSLLFDELVTLTMLLLLLLFTSRSFPFIQQWWGHSWCTVSSSGLYSMRETWTCCKEPSKRHWWWLKNWYISSYEERLRDLGLSRLEKRRTGRSWSICTNTWGEGVKKMGPGCFQLCPVTGEAAMSTNWNTTKHKWVIFHCEDEALEWVAQRGWGVSHLGGV